MVVTIAGAATGLLGGLLVLAANPRLPPTPVGCCKQSGIGCIAVALLVLLRTLVAALRRLRERP